MATAVSEDGLLVGGEPTAVLAASSALYEVALRTDNVGGDLVAALGPAATTVMAATPFAPVQAGAVESAMAAVVASPSAGLGTVAAAYEAASLQLRLAGEALELAGVATLLSVGGAALARGERPVVLPDGGGGGVDLRREAMSAGLSLEALGETGALSVRLVERPDGTTFYVVELKSAAQAAASFGGQLNGAGAMATAATGLEATQRWAVPSRHDAELLIAALSASTVLVAGSALNALVGRSSFVPPPPTEVTIGSMASLAGTATSPVVASGMTGTLTVRNEVTVLADGGQRLIVSLRGSGQAALQGVAGVGGAGALAVGVELDPAGQVSKLSLTTSEEIDRGRHGMPVLEAGNREATLVEKRWNLAVTPELRARAERVAGTAASGRPPDEEDIRALSDAVEGVAPQVRTYDVRHQEGSFDVAAEIGLGGSVGVDTATLRTP